MTTQFHRTARGYASAGPSPVDPIDLTNIKFSAEGSASAVAPVVAYMRDVSVPNSGGVVAVVRPSVEPRTPTSQAGILCKFREFSINTRLWQTVQNMGEQHFLANFNNFEVSFYLSCP